MVRKKLQLSGFSLAELLIVVALIAILAVFGLLAFQQQTIKGFDSKRKTDLSKLRVVLEDYYNDKGYYPSMGDWKTYYGTMCTGGQFLTSYLQGNSVPCDPVINTPYLYMTVNRDGAIEESDSVRTGYKLFAALGNLSDMDIPGSGCSPDPTIGCGYLEGNCEYCSPKYNYGISIGGLLANDNPIGVVSTPALTPAPTSAYVVGDWFCTQRLNSSGQHECRSYQGLVYRDDGSRSCRDVLLDATIGGCRTSYVNPDECNIQCRSNYVNEVCIAAESGNYCVFP